MSERFDEAIPSGSIDLVSPVLAFSPDAVFLDAVDFDRDGQVILDALGVAVSKKETCSPFVMAIALLPVFGIPQGQYNYLAAGFLCRLFNLLFDRGILEAQIIFDSLKEFARQRQAARERQQ